MKLALISDIHGNWDALRAVLPHIPADHQILCCGDFIGYYPDVNEVCDWARSNGVVAIRGNHEAMWLGAIDYAPELEPHYRLKEASARLSQANADWLRALPIEQTLEFGKWRVRLRHASPWDETSYLYPDSPLLHRVEVAPEEVLCLGHTHRPILRRLNTGWLLNPGSVGQPRDYDPTACLMLGDSDLGDWRLVRVGYDHLSLQNRLRKLGYPAKSIEILGRTA